MGLRFRKSIFLGKFLRLNLSKSGVSVGVGPRGLNVNFGPRGVRRTAGLPGTGLYYQDIKQWPKSTETAPSPNSGAESSSGIGWKILGLILLVIAIAVYFGGGSPTRNSKGAAANLPQLETQPTKPTVPPKPDRPLTRDEVRELQSLLRRQGFDAGMPDGIIGPKTRAATQAFARARHISTQGRASLQLLKATRDHSK